MLKLLNELRVRYFIDQDVQPVFARTKAALINIDGNPFWVPHSVINKHKLYNTKTGESIFDGYWVDEWWVRRNPDRSKLLRLAPIDYFHQRPKVPPGHKLIKQ